jgi:hypothetical protein
MADIRHRENRGRTFPQIFLLAKFFSRLRLTGKHFPQAQSIMPKNLKSLIIHMEWLKIVSKIIQIY